MTKFPPFFNIRGVKLFTMNPENMFTRNEKFPLIMSMDSFNSKKNNNISNDKMTFCVIYMQ